MDQIKMVVFDMAGTTVKDDNEVERCFVLAAQKTGLKYTTEEIIAMMGWSKRLVFETLWKKNLPNAEDAEIQYKTDHSYAEFKVILENNYLTQSVSPVEGAKEIFSYLKKEDVKIVLTTGFYRKVTDIILQRLGWDKELDENYKGNSNSIIDLSVSSDQVASGRPSPAMINKAMEVFGVSDPKRVVKIGDTPSDLQAGRNANCYLSLGVTYGTHSYDQLAKYDNDGLLDSIVELKKYLV
ncbi:HAD family hydrolase [Maribellus sp. YY47]|uniref:HAD family hydrolase n=1 Tax=Maribellus sp. YY47 TaxID=2929486 RepID=UPI002001A1B2|nr:HAD family hydrolase [Maribellus sp. YY47]MCK3684814.1 HAD hydrolase-like protein [Maribellus sp. YY47]